MASRLLEIEHAILERLAPLSAAHNVRIGALDASELRRPVGSGQLFVNYRSSTASYPDYNSVQEAIQFEILVKYEDLRTHSQAYPLLEVIRVKLNGFVPTDFCEEMQWRSQKFDVGTLNEAGIWVYSMIFEVMSNAN